MAGRRGFRPPGTADPACQRCGMARSQIGRTLRDAAAAARTAEILSRKGFDSRSALGRRVCGEFPFLDARGRPQLSGCLKALADLAERVPGIGLPPPKAPAVTGGPQPPRRRGPGAGGVPSHPSRTGGAPLKRRAPSGAPACRRGGCRRRPARRGRRPAPGVRRSARRPERSLRLRRQGASPRPAGQLPPGPPVRPRSRMRHHGGPRSDPTGWPLTDGRCPILSDSKGMGGIRPDAVLQPLTEWRTRAPKGRR